MATSGFQSLPAKSALVDNDQILVFDSEDVDGTHPEGKPKRAGVSTVGTGGALTALAGTVSSLTTNTQAALDAHTTALAGKQPLASALTAIAALTPTNDAVIQRKAGAWTYRSPAQVKADLGLVSSDLSDFDSAVAALIAGVVGAAPGALNTLVELAAAMGNDPSFATTMATALGLRALDADVVHKAATETITGTKTFSTAPAVPDASFAQAKITGLVAALATLTTGAATEVTDRAAAVAAEAATRLQQVQNLQANVAAVQADVLDIGEGPPGVPGLTMLRFATDDPTQAAVTGWNSRPLGMPVGGTVEKVIPQLAGDTAGSAPITFDVLIDGGAGAASIFSTSPTDTRPQIGSGQFVGAAAVPAFPAFDAGDQMQVSIVSAPTGAGSLTRIASAVSGNGDTTSPTSHSIKIPAGTELGDLLVTDAAGGVSTMNWPTGWTPHATAVGSATGPQYHFIATKAADAADVAAAGASTGPQSVTHSANPVIVVTTTLRSAEVDTPTGPSAGVSVVTSVASITTPTDISSHVANTIVLHFALMRFTSGLFPDLDSWSNSLTTDTNGKGVSNRTASTNFGLAVTHEAKATAAALSARTYTYTAGANLGRASTTSVIIKPGSGAVGAGPEVYVWVREAA